MARRLTKGIAMEQILQQQRASLISVIFALFGQVSAHLFLLFSNYTSSRFSSVIYFFWEGTLLSSGQFQLNIRCHCRAVVVGLLVVRAQDTESGWQDGKMAASATAGTASSSHIKAEAVCLCKCLHMSLAPYPVTHHLPFPHPDHVLTTKQCLSCMLCVCGKVCLLL